MKLLAIWITALATVAIALDGWLDSPPLPLPPSAPPACQMEVERVSNSSLAKQKHEQAISGAVEVEGRLVAVGTYGVAPRKQRETAEPVPYATVWTSNDARSWDRLDYGPSTLGGSKERMTDITYANGIYVAVGHRDLGVGGMNAAVWTSTNATQWDRVYEPGFAGSEDDLFGGVTYHGGLFRAVGGSGPPTERDGVVWTSEDGEEWEQLDTLGLGGVGRQYLATIVATDEGYVAAGYDEASDPGTSWDAAVWTSSDGVTWERVTDDSLGGRGPQTINDLGAESDFFLAVGEDATTDQDSSDAAIWRSPDGSEWTKLPFDQANFGGAGRQEMLGLTQFRNGWVATGVDSNTDRRNLGDGASWLIELPKDC